MALVGGTVTPDGTNRAAFNTCRVCYDSGRGCYTQKCEYPICNNCGNRFLARQVEPIKGGCNPVPITRDSKREDAEFIYIPKGILEKAKPLFLKWKKCADRVQQDSNLRPTA